MLMFGFICKKVTFFKKNCGKCQFNLSCFCVQGQPGLEIKNRDHSQTRFDATNSIVASKSRNKLPLEIMFLKVSSIVSICVKLQ